MRLPTTISNLQKSKNLANTKFKKKIAQICLKRCKLNFSNESSYTFGHVQSAKTKLIKTNYKSRLIMPLEDIKNDVRKVEAKGNVRYH